jgi:hypothetical protein
MTSRFSSLNKVEDIHTAKDILLKTDDAEEAAEAANYIFRKCAMSYKYPLNEMDKVRDRLKRIYKSARDYRYAFMHFHFYYDPMMLAIADHFFTKQIFPEFTSKVLLGQFVVRHGNDEQIEEMCEKLFRLASDSTYTAIERANLVDILIRSGDRDYKRKGLTLLDYIREEEEVAQNPKGKIVIKTIYTDTQNAHNEDVSVEVKKLLRTIYAVFDPRIFTEIDLKNINADMKQRLKKYREDAAKDVASASKDSTLDVKIFTDDILYSAFERVENDFSDFGENMTISSTLKAIYTVATTKNHIVFRGGHNEYCEQMLTRLLEELCGGEKYCASGYIGRICNAIQGFDAFEDEVIMPKTDYVFRGENLVVKISQKERINAIVQTVLMKAVLSDSDSDQLALDMIDNPDRFAKFLETQINGPLVAKLRDCKDQDVDLDVHYREHVLPAIGKFIKNDRTFIYKNGKIYIGPPPQP